MPTTTANDDELQIHVVPTFDGNKTRKNNRLAFSTRRRSSIESAASSVGSFGGLMDMFSSDPKGCNFSSSDDNLQRKQQQQQHDIDPEETFARTTPVGNRYDPSRLTPPNAVADFDLDGMNDDDDESLPPGLDESYVIDETTGQRFSVSSASSSHNNNNNNEGNHRLLLLQSPASFCKQLTGLSTVPLLILLSAGLLALAYIATNSDSSATTYSKTDGNGSSMDILLYNTEIAVTAACSKLNADW
eukprot:CAMPEP_0201737790 /NCGR_PEP_ID=MMETSP0593-20130828/43313_1 /ASSEMBLY_ACC=CAM_ASM_000672 /TAXON_ID=267983 /ORGANISM="Skeletonema japonicum, Strain CCMP2506" /LENGTH=244 /DNA_ID=CAMNT_0048231843 /DNA_START=127 /DNA_END=858 /DNA_ORIENTATION=+